MYLVGSCRIREAECLYDSAVVVGPQGLLGCYHKSFPVLEEIHSEAAITRMKRLGINRRDV